MSSNTDNATAIQSPHVHSNGTSKDYLLDRLCEASQALDKAFEALRLTVPNGRDYYPLGPDAMATAQAQHESRTRRLDAIKSEIDQMAAAVDSQ